MNNDKLKTQLAKEFADNVDFDHFTLTQQFTDIKNTGTYYEEKVIGTRFISSYKIIERAFLEGFEAGKNSIG